MVRRPGAADASPTTSCPMILINATISYIASSSRRGEALPIALLLRIGSCLFFLGPIEDAVCALAVVALAICMLSPRHFHRRLPGHGCRVDIVDEHQRAEHHVQSELPRREPLTAPFGRYSASMRQLLGICTIGAAWQRVVCPRDRLAVSMMASPAAGPPTRGP